MSNPGFSVAEDRRYRVRSAWRDHEALLESGACVPDLRAGLAATFTAGTLAPFLGAALLEKGFKPRIRLAPYNQLFQTCWNAPAQLGGDCDSIVLLWRIEDLMLDELSLFLDGEESALASATEKLDRLLEAVMHLRANFEGGVLLGTPPFPAYGPKGLCGPGGPAPFLFQAAIARALRERLKGSQDIHLLDLDAAQAEFGVAASLDWRQWYLYRQPFSEAFLLEIGRRIARMLAAARRPGKKCIVLDADNTLWGGTIGEDGLDGIAIGEDFPGSAFRDFQRHLLHLRKQGVLLAVASKNNEADLLEVFDRHDGMLLKREHISAWAVHWRPKAESIVEVARTLNIGTDSLVFIDDNAMEVAYMREAHPEVTSLQLPDEPAQMVPFLQGLALFDSLEITGEDRERADMMRAEAARQDLAAQALTPEQFQKGLELKIDLSAAAAQDLGRVAQLINKTNQFNLTTIRRSLEEVRALHASPRHRLFVVKVSDRFGDYGLTGVVIVERDSERRWMIDTLLLSCRVLGRGVETALLAALAEEARAEGVEEIMAAFIPTAKNIPARDFLPDHGFSFIAGNSWRIPIEALPGSSVRTSDAVRDEALL